MATTIMTFSMTGTPNEKTAAHLSRCVGVSLLFLTIAVAGCAPRTGEQSVTIKGSDTMVQLGQRWAELYMRSNPGVVIQVTGGGSGTGIAALINGSTDIAQASRTMKREERISARERRGADVAEIPVALDALAVYVNVLNGVESLSIDQISQIFKGEITNWREVGGSDRDIILYGRENSSGTYVYFREHVMGDADFAGTYQSLPGTAAVINAVTADPVGVGYGGIGYASGIKTIAIRTGPDSSPVDPTRDNVWSSAYPLSRNLFFYIVGEPEGLTKKFVDWTLGPAGQSVVSEVGYYPLRPKESP